MDDIGQFMNDAFFDDPDFERMFENQVLMEENHQNTDEVTSVPFMQVNVDNCPFNKETVDASPAQNVNEIVEQNMTDRKVNEIFLANPPVNASSKFIINSMEYSKWKYHF